LLYRREDQSEATLQSGCGRRILKLPFFSYISV